MKDLKYSLFLLMSLLTFCCISCSDDDKDEIVSNVKFEFESLSDMPLLVYPGDEISFNLKVSSTSNVKKVMTKLNGKDLESGTMEYSGTSKEESYVAIYKVLHDDIGTTLNFVTEAYDSDGNKAKKEQAVYVQSSKAVINIELPTDVPTEVVSNEKLEFVIKVSSEEPLRYIKTILNDNELVELTETDFIDTYQFDYHFAYQPNVLDEGKTITFLFEVMDSNGGLARLSYNVAVNRAIDLDINEYYGVKIGAQASTTVGPFLNINTGDVYTKAEGLANCASIDVMLFYSNSTYGYYFVSPTDTSIEASSIFGGTPSIKDWSKRNDTKFKVLRELSATDFDAIMSSDEIKQVYESSSFVETGKLTKDDKGAINLIVGFKTEANKYGIMIIRSFASGSTSGNITIDLKATK